MTSVRSGRRPGLPGPADRAGPGPAGPRLGRQAERRPAPGAIPPALRQSGPRRAGRRGGACRVAGIDLAISTDTFVVSPLEFPGGNIGSLAVHGTAQRPGHDGCPPGVSDRGLRPGGGAAVRAARSRRRRDGGGGSRGAASRSSPATPRWWSGARPTGSTSTPRASGVRHPGVSPAPRPGPARRRDPGERAHRPPRHGDHGRAGGLAFETEIESDSAALWPLVRPLLEPFGAGGPRAARSDPRRGGERAQRDRRGLGRRDRFSRKARSRSPDPWRRRARCWDSIPLYVANEGVFVAHPAPVFGRSALWR